MPRNYSEHDRAREPLLAWAEVAEKARLSPSQTPEEREAGRVLVRQRNELKKAVPKDAFLEHWAGRTLIREIVESIYDKYGYPNAA